MRDHDQPPDDRAVSAWRHRDFRLLWLGETTSKVGTSITAVAAPLVAVTTLHAGPFAVGLLVAAQWLPWLVIGLPAGAWVDRLSARAVMLACDLVSVLAFVSVPVANWLDVLGLGQLLVVSFVAGIASVFFSTAYVVYLPSLVDSEDLVDGNAKLQGSEAAARIAGPGLGGVIAQAFGAASGMLADAVSFVVSAACLLGIRTPERRPAQPRTGRIWRDVATGLKFVSGDRLLLLFAITAALSNLTTTAIATLQVPFLVRTVGVNSAVVGALIMAGGAGGVIGAVISARAAARWGTARTALLSVAATTPFGVLIPLTRDGGFLVFFVIGVMMPMLGAVVYNVIIGSFRQAYCPPELLGRVTATMRFLVYGTIPLAGIIAGGLGAAIGIRPAMWVVVIANLVPGVVLLASPLRTMRALPDAMSSKSPTIPVPHS